MEAVSILTQYTTNHIGKLDEYIKLHVFDFIPAPGVSWIFREGWGDLVGIHPNSLPLDCPHMIFKMMSSLVHPWPIGSELREYHGVDLQALSLRFPVPGDDVDHSAEAVCLPRLCNSQGHPADTFSAVGDFAGWEGMDPNLFYQS